MVGLARDTGADHVVVDVMIGRTIHNYVVWSAHRTLTRTLDSDGNTCRDFDSSPVFF